MSFDEDFITDHIVINIRVVTNNNQLLVIASLVERDEADPLNSRSSKPPQSSNLSNGA